MLTSALRASKPLTPSTHRLQRGLPGYLILFAPHAFAPQRQYRTRQPPSPLVFLLISTNFTSTLGIPLTSFCTQVKQFPMTSRLSRGFHQTYFTACARFTPNNSGQRLPHTYYRGCWHVFSRGFLVGHRHLKASYYLQCSSLTTEFYEPKPFITHAALLRQTCVHCGRFPTAASVGVWAVSQSQCGRSPSQAGYASSPGEPLSHQLANAPQAHP